MLEGSGIQTRILRIPGHAPVVCGHVISKARNSRTLLFYDVQPAELDLWTHPPFEGVVENNRVYGRGATDDKGDLVSRIEAVRRMAESGDIPCNVKFFIEGEEENGSAGVPKYLEQYRDLLSCDAVV